MVLKSLSYNRHGKSESKKNMLNKKPRCNKEKTYKPKFRVSYKCIYFFSETTKLGYS